MSNTPTSDRPTSSVSEYAALAVRSIVFHRGGSLRQLAAEMSVGEHWTLKRLGAKSRSVDLTLDDAQRIADALEVPLAQLLPSEPVEGTEASA